MVASHSLYLGLTILLFGSAVARPYDNLYRRTTLTDDHQSAIDAHKSAVKPNTDVGNMLRNLESQRLEPSVGWERKSTEYLLNAQHSSRMAGDIAHFPERYVNKLQDQKTFAEASRAEALAKQQELRQKYPDQFAS